MKGVMANDKWKEKEIDQETHHAGSQKVRAGESETTRWQHTQPQSPSRQGREVQRRALGFLTELHGTCDQETGWYGANRREDAKDEIDFWGAATATLAAQWLSKS